MNRRVLLAGVAVVAATVLVSAAYLAVSRGSGPPLVYIVYDSADGDRSYTDSALQGLADARNGSEFRSAVFNRANRTELGRRIRESRGPERPGLVITVGYNFVESTREWAGGNPDMMFLAIDQAGIGGGNIRATGITAYGSSYLAGVLAADATVTGRVGIILGAPSTVLDGFRDGYLAGIRATNRTIATEVRYIANDTGGFMDPERAGEIAGEMYRNGTDVIFTVAGFSGTGAIREAEKGPGRYVIGVDTDQSALGPSVVLASAVKRVDVPVTTGIREYLNGTFAGGDEVAGLPAGATGIVFNPRFGRFAEAVAMHRPDAVAEEERYLAGRGRG